MKSMFRKVAPWVLLASSVAVAAGVITKEEVNKKVASLTAPYNNASTSMKIEFTDLNVDAVRALDFGINVAITKEGAENKLALQLKDASYHYGDGSAPTVQGRLLMRLDLVKAFGQPTLNDLGAQLEDIAKGAVAEYGKKYGEAVAVDVKMEDVKKDAEGNLLSARLRFNASFDLAKLPADLKPEDVELRSVKAVLAAGRNGISGRLEAVINPQYKGFQSNEPGLKEYIEKLLSDDKDTYEEIGKALSSLDGIAEWLVTQKAPEPQP
ncbi:hypothetical protein QJS83_01255 [Bdellovibrio sp. 22V]|uniref:hypothetical protein n=1 Tax=Bdellovibrio TaxID=958 RepID=UPI0025438B9F|nr:hypothetical protein [Bdellovibrio sp. 22V]WII72495.1 hypothetical protein QJS83_01255 [Bdellovibrio sp. 22V]